jgi:hypothetical protein
LTNGPTVQVPVWQPHDFTFANPARAENLFQVSFAAEITGPGVNNIVLPGFFNGNGRHQLTPPADWGQTPIALQVGERPAVQ